MTTDKSEMPPSLESWTLTIKHRILADGTYEYEAAMTNADRGESYRARGPTRAMALDKLAELHNPLLSIYGFGFTVTKPPEKT